MKNKYIVVFYKSTNNRCPINEFLDSLQLKPRAKIMRWIEQLELKGPGLKRPFADIVNGKIRELRVVFGGNAYRILYFFFMDKRIILTHGFKKKTKKIPAGEIAKAENIMVDFIKRFNKGGIAL